MLTVLVLAVLLIRVFTTGAQIISSLSIFYKNSDQWQLYSYVYIMKYLQKLIDGVIVKG